MVWKPWYDRVAEMDSASEREEYMKGVFGPPPLRTGQVAGMALTALMANFGVSKVKRAVWPQR